MVTLVPKIKTKIFSSESLSNEDININEVPYISTYYIKPKVKTKILKGVNML